MSTFQIVITFAVFALVCVWWIGNLANNIRKQNSELVDKMIAMAEHASIRRLDRDAEPQLPDYIPLHDGSGGFYKQADGQFVAVLDGQKGTDSPLGGKTTVETVDGVFPTVDELELEEER